MINKVFDIINEAADSRLILTCEHAGALVPPAYQGLGLPSSTFDSHIARDKGAREVTERLAAKIGCPAICGCYSRLLIDLNRREDETELIVAESDKTLILGNVNISAAERQKRIETFYRPYYHAIGELASRVIARGERPIFFSVHSFTPQLKGGDYRPWQAGILYHQTTPLANYLYRELEAAGDKKIGENVPYDLRQCNTGAAIICGEEKGFDYALIEIRDDEFDNMARGADDWAGRLAAALEKYLSC